MKIAVSVHGRYHAFELARQLCRRGMLKQLMTTYPPFVARRFIPDAAAIDSAPLLEIWRRCDGRVPFVSPSQPGLSRAFGRFAARRLDKDVDLLVGWSSATLEAVSVARKRGATVVIERGSSHILHQTEQLREEYARFGIAAEATPAAIVERELMEYAEADAIAVPSRLAAGTFVARGIAENRLIVNPLGTDAERFAAIERPDRVSSVPVILFVGEVGVRKGVVWLLRAFSRLSGRARLRLVGPVEKGFRPVLAREPMDNVDIVGPLGGAALRDAFTEADVLCLPSIEEGFGMVVLEAMAAGLPVVVTDVVGAAEAIRHGREGLQVPVRDPIALAEALESLITDGETRRTMGLAARERVRTDFSWSDYGDRAVAAYESLLARGRTGS